MTSIDFSAFNFDNISLNRINLYKKYLKLLHIYLNFIHEEDKNEKYWELIIGPWLLHFIWLVDYLKSQKRNNKIETKTKYSLIPYDYKSFIILLNQTSNYSNSLISLIQEERKTDLQSKFIISRLSRVNLIRKIFYQLYNAVTKPLLKFSKVVMVSPNLSFLSLLKIIVISKLRIVPFFLENLHEEKIEFSENYERKWTHERDDFENELDKKLYEIILLQIPYVYIEGFKNIKNLLPKINNLYNLDSIFSSYGWQENELFKFFAAESHVYNINLIGYQHGGSPYGTGLDPTVLQETELVDYFFTWGWKSKEHHIPFGSIKNQIFLKKIKQSRKNVNKNSIIFMSTTGSDFWPDRIGSPSGEQWKFYYKSQVEFISKLNNQLFSNFIFRLHPHHLFSNYKQKENLNHQFPHIKYDNNLNIEKTLKKAKLVVVDNIQTLFYQIILSDTPCIVVLDMKIWKFNKEFEKIINEMIAVKILHTSIDSAIKFIESNYNSINDWWMKENVKSVISYITNNYSKEIHKPEIEMVNLLLDISKKVKPL